MTQNGLTSESELITVVCWKWRAFKGYRSKFEAEHVNTFARMIRRNYGGPLRIVCVTDDAAGIWRGPGGVDDILELWPDFADMRSPHDPPHRPARNPSCYRRLRMFSPEAREFLGGRVMSLDLDLVVTGDLTPLLTRPEPIVLWGDTNPTTYYNGGMILHSPGERPGLWTEFVANPQAAVAKARAAKQWGSDQGWIGAHLGPDEARFTKADGVYSYRNEVRPYFGRLPEDARIVFFHGDHDPWGPEAQGLAWVREHYR